MASRENIMTTEQLEALEPDIRCRALTEMFVDELAEIEARENGNRE